MQLPKIALAALTSVPDYNVDPLLLAGLHTKLAHAKTTEQTLHAALAQQQNQLAALRRRADGLRARADRAQQAKREARRQFQLAASLSYTSGSGLSPTIDAMFSPSTRSPADVIYGADIVGLYAKDQGARIGAAVQQMNQTDAAATAELTATTRATGTLLATRRRDLAAQRLATQVQAKIKARIIVVRRDLAAKRAAQRARSGSSIKLWKGYLSELGAYGVAPPSAATLRDPRHLPRGLRPLTDATGRKQAGVATVRTRHGDVLVLPTEVIAAIGFAYAQLGKPYVWAATGPKSYDCSGLTLASYRSAGITSMPRTAAEQYAWTSRIGRGEEMPGDLVFFAGDAGTMTHPGHVALVVDPARHLMIQAPQTGDVVKISDYSQWGGLVGFGRVTTAG